ncbi:cell surface protein [Brachyspira aalborgi]|uniref:Cell surface protein n=1 Tax=Brachyspira aalborgi TaxID=29522 RepID=A0A5C8CCC9_9SPIR|nr:cell surface protein [Brachyspira aalborgi]TXJ11129.1 cell surface protein [Brachyspira aalborgi]
MKKIFLTTIALLSIVSASVFGMYGVDSGWIDFLTHGNQFRARLDQLGFTLGNDTIKGTFGFNNNAGYGGVYGDLLSTANGGITYDFKPSISMGLGYTSSLISVGVGYNATIGTGYKDNGKSYNPVAHTPVLVLNAMDNAFRMAIPIQVYADGNTNAVSVDSQFRYYTGLDMFPEIRLYLRYGSFTTKTGGVTSKEGESFGFDFRLYFGSMVEEVALKPYVKLVYNGALGKYHDNTRVEAVKVMKKQQSGSPIIFAKNAWILNLVAGLGLSANSDIVSLYLEPSLGLKVNQAGSADKNAKETYGLGYDVYAEIYITPLKNLEWYFEASIGNLDANTKGVSFASSTGITWYLPAL